METDILLEIGRQIWRPQQLSKQAMLVVVRTRVVAVETERSGQIGDKFWRLEVQDLEVVWM